MKTLLALPSLRRLGATLLLGGLGLALPATASAYTFTKIIPLGVNTVDGDALNIVPGDVIGIAPGIRSRLVFTNIEGTDAQPVIIANMGGKVRVGNDGNPNAISVSNCKYFKLTGDGDPAHRYGIEVTRATNGSGVQIHGGSTQFEVCFLEVHDTDFAGIMSKDEPTCIATPGGGPGTPGPYNRGNFTQRNVSFHDNYIHHTGGEGFYLGHSYYALGASSGSCGRIFPHDIIGMRVFNNVTEHTGHEGIQVGCVIEDCEIYNNVVLKPSRLNADDQNNGIQINPGTTGKLYNNTIIGSPNNGIALTGLGNNTAFNNVVVDSGAHAIFCDNRNNSANPAIGTIPGSFIRVHNNTIVKAGRYAFRSQNELSVHEFRNNLVVNVLGLTDDGGVTITLTESHNINQPTDAGLGFVNSAVHDYRIAGASSALNAGTDVSAHGVTFDREGLPRPNGAAFEVGAFEAGALSAVITAWTHPSLPRAADGSLTVTAVGGTPPYTYAWAGGGTTATVTGRARGLHTVTVTDAANVQRVRSFTLVDPPSLEVLARILPELDGASDGSITLVPSGIPPYTVTWAHGPTGVSLTGLAPGFYTYTATDASDASASETLYVRDGGVPVHRVNAGGNAETDRLLAWTADRPGASSHVVPPTGTISSGPNTWAGSAGNPTEGPSNLFGDRRYIVGALMSWEFPVTNGSYEVQLFFNENTTGYTVGTRVFDVEIEGRLALDNFDAVARHGFERPSQYTFWVDVTDGKVDIDFRQVAGNPMVSGIAIHSHDGGLPTGTPVIRVNAGGNTLADPPLDWSADKNPSPSPYLVSAGQLNTGPNTWSGPNATGAPNNLFANYRYDPTGGAEMQWEFPLPAGAYRLNLLYREPDSTVTAGQRLFDVAVEGTVLWTDLDPFAEFGSAAGRESVVLNVTDGKLDLDFFHKNTRAPIINGISIHRVK